MASFSNTELNATVQEKWDQDVEDGRYSEAVLMPRIANKSAVASKGDIIHLSYKGVYTVGNVASNGVFAPQVYTLNSTPINMTSYKQVAIEVEEQAQLQSLWSPESDFPTDAGKAFGAHYDNVLGALHASFTSNVIGDAATPDAFKDDAMRTAMLRLSDRNVPKNDLSWVLPPIAFYLGIASQPEFTDAQRVGLPKSILTTNFRFQLLGVPFYESTQLTTVGTAIKGFLLHRTAMAIAFNRKNEFRRAQRTAALVLSDVIVGFSLYGSTVWREDHGAVINIRNT